MTLLCAPVKSSIWMLLMLTWRMGRFPSLEKGRTQKERMTLPEPTKVALKRWIEIRRNSSASDSALFLNFDRMNKGQSKRLTRTGLYQLIRGLGERLNFKMPSPWIKTHFYNCGCEIPPSGVVTESRMYWIFSPCERFYPHDLQR